MINRQNKNDVRAKRHQRIRNRIQGTSLRPRLSVYRSTGEIYAQIIDDTKGVTLAASSTKSKDLAEKLAHGGNIDAAKIVGEDIAKKAAAKGIKDVIFDRGGFLFHGRVQALADAAREAGLNF